MCRVGEPFAEQYARAKSCSALRVLWVFTAFRADPTLPTLVAAFPLSWLCVATVNGAVLCFVCRRLIGNNANVFPAPVKNRQRGDIL